jgi:hypothetical protein
MTRVLVRCVTLVCGVAMVMVGQAEAQTCDRGCLRTILDQYLAAVAKHDPAAAPLVIGYRHTENALNKKLGDGVWKSVTGLGTMQRKYFDAVTGQAAYYGLIDEGTSPALVTARIRVQDRKITEGEWFIARPDDPGLQGPRQPGRGPANLFNAEYLSANPPPERVVPRDKRVDRGALERIVDSYFDAITSHDGSVALTHPGCGRVENGSPAPAGRFLPPAARAGGPGAPGPGGGNAGAPAGAQQPGAGSNDCVSNLQNFNLSMVVARRVPLIDEEAQAVLAYAVFIRRPGSPTPRNAFSEWFFIDEAKIRTIYTAMYYPGPELAVPNWPPYDGNWPLPAGTVPTPAAPAQK